MVLSKKERATLNKFIKRMKKDIAADPEGFDYLKIVPPMCVTSRPKLEEKVRRRILREEQTIKEQGAGAAAAGRHKEEDTDFDFDFD